MGVVNIKVFFHLHNFDYRLKLGNSQSICVLEKYHIALVIEHILVLLRMESELGK